jgi:hypothetical protein
VGSLVAVRALEVEGRVAADARVGALRVLALAHIVRNAVIAAQAAWAPELRQCAAQHVEGVRVRAECC